MYRKVLMLHTILVVSAFALAQAGPAPAAPSSGALAPSAPNCDWASALPVSLTEENGQPFGALYGGPCNCPRTPAKTTRIEALGTNCTAALDNLSNLTDDQVAANCNLGSDGVCTEGTVIVTLACAYNPSAGKYSVTGYRYYTCQYCQ